MKLTKQELTFAIVVTLALAIGYFASDIYVPAMPMIREFFHITVAQTQQTLSVYFIGYAMAQLLTGPIIDHFGYRKIILISCSLLIVTSALCAFASTFSMLLAGRFLQALAAGSVSIIARASFVKYYSAEKATDIYVTISPAVSLSPAIAPVIGGALVHAFDWRSAFVFLLLVVVLLFIALWLVYHIKEQRPADSSIHPVYIAKTYFKVINNKRFCRYLVLTTTTFTAYLAYITEAPFIFHLVNYSAKQIGYTFFPIALSFFIATQIVSRLNKHMHKHLNIYIGLSIQLMGYLLLMLVTILNLPIYWVVIFLSLALFGAGFIVPTAFSSAIVMYTERSGYAASILAAVPFIFSTLGSLIVHQVCGTSVIALSLFCGVIALVGLVLFIVLRGKENA